VATRIDFVPYEIYPCYFFKCVYTSHNIVALRFFIGYILPCMRPQKNLARLVLLVSTHLKESWILRITLLRFVFLSVIYFHMRLQKNRRNNYANMRTRQRI